MTSAGLFSQISGTLIVTMRAPDWTTLSRRTVYDGRPWVSVHVERVRTGAGRELADFHQVEARDFAMVFALDAEGRVPMVRQWRHGPRRPALSFPGGHVDPGENPAAAAARECLEETGHACAAMTPMGRFCMHPNLGLGWGSFFFCASTEPAPAPPAEDSAEIERILLAPDDVVRALNEGTICTMHDALCATLGLALVSSAKAAR